MVRDRQDLENRWPDTDWLYDLRAYIIARRKEYLAHRDGARTFSGTLVTDPDILRARELWLHRWVAAGVPPTAAFDAMELATRSLSGFVIEEQERLQSAADPTRYASDERDRRLGRDRPFVSQAGHARDHDDRFDRQLATVLAGRVQRGGAPAPPARPGP